MGAVVDTGQHDERRNGRQCVRCGQQHGNGGYRANAWQHANERTQQATNEGINQILEGESNTKTQGQVIDQIHLEYSLT